MDGRTAAINVLFGVSVGICVPIAGAIVLANAHPDFEWADHVFTIFMLSIACGGIGVLVNLPWQTRLDSDDHAPHTAPPYAPSDVNEESGVDADPHKLHAQTAQGEAAAPGKRYAMSRREAFRTLELEQDADENSVRDAFRKLAKAHHPDHANAEGEEAIAQATAKFQQIRAAYDVLVDDAG